VKKKYSATSQDKRDWINFTKKMGKVSNKDLDLENLSVNINKIQKLDLHGCSLEKSNKIVKRFITESSNSGYRKLIIVTGKGLRSKIYNDPYRSEKMNVLRHAVPEYIRNDEDLSSKVTKISQAETEDGGDGAIYVFLRDKKKIIK